MSKYTNFDLRNFIAEGKKAKSENIEETAPGFNHDCAAHVVHETYGYGICLDEAHTLVENADGTHSVSHYDVFFKTGNKTVKNIPVEDLEVLTESNHGHKKKKDEEVVAAEGETVEVTEEDQLDEQAATDLIDLVQNLDPSQIAMLASYIGGIGGAVAAKLKATDYCEANPDNKICRAWKSFSQDAGAAIARKKRDQGFEEGVEETTKLTKEEAFKNEIKDILDS